MERKTYHIGLWNFAREFYWAANNLRGNETLISKTPTYYLYGHALELVLKSYLVFKGFKEKDIRNLGHNLINLWDKAIENKLDESLTNNKSISDAIRQINPYYEAKELEYIVPGFKQFPYIQDLHQTVETLILSIGSIIEIPDSQLNKTLQRTLVPRSAEL